MPRDRRALVYAATGLVGSLGLVGVLHLPLARPVLQLFAGLCPVNNVSADAVERLQASASAALRGTGPIPSRDTFALQTLFGGRQKLDAWVAGLGTPCDRFSRGFAYVSCEHVATASGERQILVSYDRAGVVRAVDVIGHATTPASAAAAASMVAQEFERRFGEPDARDGMFVASYLDQPFRTASTSYRFVDAFVTVRVTNIPGSGLVVEERYVAPGLGLPSVATPQASEAATNDSGV